ncbi:MAG: tyrosine-type recombinase/integrase [Clostridia bacterium]|jgi:integrase|nr:tyrosine-type recombinase/integrase [Clostridia bacterium]DAO96523.1 MAG TPA: Integrase [Caudoviricetes sp.]DAY80480.1 MAG TPA: Integrase [Caudoviricetes sp.]
MGTSKKRGNGEGTIFKREIKGKTYWIAEYTIEMYDKNGKRKRKTISGKTRQEVKLKLEKVITELNTNTYVDKSKITFYQIAKEFIDTGYEMNKLKPSSYQRKLNTLKSISTHYIANMELQKITEKDLKDFFAYITKYSNSTIAKIYGIVNNTFKIAVRRNILRFNFLDDQIEFSIPYSNNRDKKVSAFTIEEQKKLIIALKETTCRYKYQFLISLFTGMRMGEINALDLDDIDFENKIIHIRRTITRGLDERAMVGSYTKTKSGTRDIIMDSNVEAIFREYLSSSYYYKNDLHLLFCNSRKQCISTDATNMMFKYICEQYNIGNGSAMHQHMLRHTYATRCIESGMPASVLAKIMGHANVSTTLNVYCEVFDKFKQSHIDLSLNYLKENDLLINF